MSQVLNDYLKNRAEQKRIQEQNLFVLQKKLLTPFADQLDQGSIVDMNDIRQSFVRNRITYNLDPLHVLAQERNCVYLYDEDNNVLALGDKSDIRRDALRETLEATSYVSISIAVCILVFMLVTAVMYLATQTEPLISPSRSSLMSVMMISAILAAVSIFASSNINTDLKLYGRKKYHV